MDTQRGNARKTPWQIFATPTLIALLSLVGLLAALLGNGVFDWVSWVGLAAPVVIVGWAMKARHPQVEAGDQHHDGDHIQHRPENFQRQAAVVAEVKRAGQRQGFVARAFRACRRIHRCGRPPEPG